MTTDVPPALGRRALLRGTQVLLGLFGAVKLYGTAYFTFFATAEQGGDLQGLGDWTVAAWSAALAVAFLFAAFRLGSDRRVLPALAGLIALDLVFGVVKFAVYDEQESVGFMAVGAVLIVLLALSRPAVRGRA
ncbi:hypothetical protein [Blastococcus atacamensis]|uniref:hypothetical protein n=1 Tax=Blastococcus atacamensis TaxID=2070508 RepID=UPI000CEC5F96|nr:hypothetical protein [Blastococcus atacamensis]